LPEQLSGLLSLNTVRVPFGRTGLGGLRSVASGELIRKSAIRLVAWWGRKRPVCFAETNRESGPERRFRYLSLRRQLIDAREQVTCEHQ
jgi:hypothetical protein